VKLLETLFVVVVFGAFAAAWLRERSRTREPDPVPSDPGAVELAPLEWPEGTLELAGSVVSATGEPAGDVLISLEEEGFIAGTGGPRRATPLAWTYSDEQGRFRLARLVPGLFTAVLVSAAAPPTTIAVELPASGEVRWQLAPQLPPLPVLPELHRTRLRGRVVAPEGLAEFALDGHEVVLRPAPGVHPLSGAVVRRAACDAEGRFELAELALERYQVEVLPPWARGGSWPVLASRTLDGLEPRESSDFTIELECGELSGRVLDAEGRALEGALVKLWPAQEAGESQLWPPSATDEQGTFVVRDLPPGRYRLRLRAGAAEHELEVEVEAGKRNELALPPLDPRAGPPSR
jgi:hypothetical protein